MDIERFVEEKRSQLHKLMDDIVASDLILINNDLARLQEIQKRLSIPQYRLVFIGNPGSGKTTTICNYLNLVDDDLVGKTWDKTHIELFMWQEEKQLPSRYITLSALIRSFNCIQWR